MSHHPTDQRDVRTEPIDRKSISVREIVSWAAMPALGIACWGFGIAWTHEGRLNKVETTIDLHDRSDQAKDVRLRDDLAEIKATLREQSAKLDAMKDRIK